MLVSGKMSGNLPRGPNDDCNRNSDTQYTSRLYKPPSLPCKKNVFCCNYDVLLCFWWMASTRHQATTHSPTEPPTTFIINWHMTTCHANTNKLCILKQYLYALLKELFSKYCVGYHRKIFMETFKMYRYHFC